ncbi:MULTISPECIES: hypothetical protein [Exiguobacterium]|uniref:Uncharacterized protein n=1 Tax=Exiguobacterium sibiricum (strain DSM 17290 / CCUG 55495 / CIP 109462 / JCM 13490 / 255-15) TaxID=262543 RepID=B1YIH0_EXIS2|nr:MULTISPECIES: hypothetical protein [Exiguobacterium]ACB59853.1 hypothetical protein Exig_0369 [Exiguobacterium sibiricum 255-15]RDB32540.1 hypothetical protein DVG79_12665 [Exiguobacterium sp. RIT594]
MKRIQIADFDRRMPPLELREMDDYYEAVLVSNYDELYPSTQVRTIQLADIYVNLVMTSEGAHLVSALFLKPVEVPDIVAWMQLYTIGFATADATGYYVEQADEILEIVLYQGNPIVIATRGTDRLYYETEGAIEMRRESSEVIGKKPLLYLNGEARFEVPHLEFNPNQDEIHINGTFLFADYMDTYQGRVGFFRKTDSNLPIVLLVGKAIIEMELTENPDGSRILVIEQPYDEA